MDKSEEKIRGQVKVTNLALSTHFNYSTYRVEWREFVDAFERVWKNDRNLSQVTFR
jgi:hypothetical protein